MESRIESNISHPIRRTEMGEYQNRKQKKKKANSRRTCEDIERNLSTNQYDDQMTGVLTEFDEAERLFLPQYKFVKERLSEIGHNYPKHYNYVEYRKLTAAVDRRKYRNSKDLRNNLGNGTKKSERFEDPEHSEYRLCYTQFRGRKCDNETCLFKHEFRLPRKLRLCRDWKKGSCPHGPCCLYLHSEFPCQFFYLGLRNAKHDSQTCRFHHGGPLPKEYEEMFLDSIDLEKYPTSTEMYKNRRIELEATTGKSTFVEQKTDSIRNRGLTDQQEIVDCDTAAVEGVIENQLHAVVDCSSDESSLHIDEKLMD